MKKTQQKKKHRGGKTQKRKSGTQKRKGEMKRKVMLGGDKTGRSEGYKSYRSSRPVFQAVKNQKIREKLPFIPEKYKVTNNKITYKLPGAFTSNEHMLNEDENKMYQKYLESIPKGESKTNDSIKDWVTFVNNWRQSIDDRAESNAQYLLGERNVNGPH